MKQRLSEQDEFKTIFNELDEGIIIIENKRISKFNNVFQGLISKYFDKTSIKKVRMISDAKEKIQLDKDIQKNQSRTMRCKNFVAYLVCWRENKKISDITNDDRIMYFKMEN